VSKSAIGLKSTEPPLSSIVLRGEVGKAAVERFDPHRGGEDKEAHGLAVVGWVRIGVDHFALLLAVLAAIAG
jgi:hypothetical protein